MTEELSGDEARRIALAAQGFAAPAPPRPSIRHVRGVAKRLHALQLDSVNVLARAHYLTVYSRVGPYPVGKLDASVNTRHELVELDAHQASLVPVELEPLFRSRRRRLGANWRQKVEQRRPGYVEAVERAVTERGRLGVKDLDDPGRRRKPKASELSVRRRDGRPYAESSLLWWRSSDAKEVLDGLLLEGRLALAGRGGGFERLYDLPERVIPPEVRARPTPSGEEAARELVLLASQALGVGTVNDLAGYFMLKVASVRKVARDLVGEGALIPASVEGWERPAFLQPGARMPALLDARALLSPFDSLTWSRERVKRLFGFDFSFEIYVSAAKRRYGYYVLPFLLGDRLVARVDLKADRGRQTLMVEGAFAEPGREPGAIVPDLAGALRQMASWLGLERVEAGERGDLARALATALRGNRRGGRARRQGG